MKKIISIFVFLLLMIVSVASVSGASITLHKTDKCNSAQTSFSSTDSVYVSGSDFVKNSLYNWSIEGNSGSCDVSVVVNSGSANSVGNGNIGCFEAYTVPADDCGNYTVTLGSVSTTYNNPNAVPEFGLIAVVVLIAGVAGILIFRNK